MATRLSVQNSREALYEFLKSSCLLGTLAPGTLLPAVRELSEQHGVTNHAVFQVIQRLTDEGLVYTVPRVGAFVGRPQQETIEPYLMIVPSREASREDYWIQAQAGFEDRIAQLGGHSTILTPLEVEEHRRELPSLSGVFGTDQDGAENLFAESGIPRVLFGDLKVEDETADRVRFDDVDGGTQATRHLWQNGHRAIAFLALHNPDDIGLFSWSQRRELGWQKASEQVGIDTEGLAFHPRKTSDIYSRVQLESGREAAEKLVGRTDITAVVAANIFGAQGMFETFQQNQWPAEKWPAVVCFDAAPGVGNAVVSYMRLAWEEIGREAAQVLWERRNGRLEGAAVQRQVPMRLIPRLSCRPDWATSSGLVQSRISSSVSQNRPIHREPLIAAGA